MPPRTPDDLAGGNSLQGYMDGSFFGNGDTPKVTGGPLASMAGPTDPAAGAGNLVARKPPPPTGGIDQSTGGPGGGPIGVGYLPPDNYTWGANPQDGLLAALNGGYGTTGNGQNFADVFNQHYGLQPGSSLAYYHNFNGGGQDVFSLPGGYATKEGSDKWNWVNRTETAGGSGQGNGQGFNDPAYQQLLSLSQQMIGKLGQPVQTPQLDQYMAMLQQNEGQAKQRAQTFADQMNQRIGQLNQPLLTNANVVQQRALASNNLLASRDTALANARQALAARGMNPDTSGLGLNQQNIIQQQYGNQQTGIDAQLQSQQIQGDEQRRNEATQLQGLVTQALQGGDLAALQSQAQSADMENQLYNLNNQRGLEQLQVAQLPVDLTNQGFSNALNASNSASNPLFAMLQLGALGQQGFGLQQNQSNSNMQLLAQILGMLG